MYDKVKTVDILTETSQKIVDIVEKPEELDPSGLKQKKELVAKTCTYCGVEGHLRVAFLSEKSDSLKVTYCRRRDHLEKDFW